MPNSQAVHPNDIRYPGMLRGRAQTVHASGGDGNNCRSEVENPKDSIRAVGRAKYARLLAGGGRCRVKLTGSRFDCSFYADRAMIGGLSMRRRHKGRWQNRELWDAEESERYFTPRANSSTSSVSRRKVP